MLPYSSPIVAGSFRYALAKKLHCYARYAAMTFPILEPAFAHVYRREGRGRTEIHIDGRTAVNA